MTILPRHAANFVLALAFLGSVLFLAGCGGDSRQPVSGTVTHDGKPVVYGTISFEPDTTKGADGPQGSAEIRLGKFKTEADKGPKTGPHVVRIMTWAAGPEAGMLGAPIIANYTTYVEIDTSGKQIDFNVPAKTKLDAACRNTPISGDRLRTPAAIGKSIYLLKKLKGKKGGA